MIVTRWFYLSIAHASPHVLSEVGLISPLCPVSAEPAADQKTEMTLRWVSSGFSFVVVLWVCTGWWASVPALTDSSMHKSPVRQQRVYKRRHVSERTFVAIWVCFAWFVLCACLCSVLLYRVCHHEDWMIVQCVPALSLYVCDVIGLSKFVVRYRKKTLKM